MTYDQSGAHKKLPRKGRTNLSLDKLSSEIVLRAILIRIRFSVDISRKKANFWEENVDFRKKIILEWPKKLNKSGIFINLNCMARRTDPGD